MPEYDADLSAKIQSQLLRKLESSQEKHRHVLDFLHECVFECDNELRFTFLNRAWQTLLGYEPSELIDHYLLDYVATPKKIQTMLQVRDSSNETVNVEMDMRSKTGHVRWFILRMRQENGIWIGSLVDIEERRRVENALKESEATAKKLALFASLTDSMSLITDASGRVEWVNRSFERTSGYSLADVVGRKPTSFLHGPDTDPVAIRRLADNETDPLPFNMQIMHYTREGKPYWVDLESKPVFDKDGPVTHIIWIETEITERLEQERALRTSERQIRYLLDNISDAIIHTDAAGNIEYVNRSWTPLTGLSAAESLARPITSLVAEAEKIQQIFDRFRTGDREPATVEVRCVTATGIERWVDLLVTPLREDYDGGFKGAICRLTNIEERRIAEQALRASRDAANTLAKNKSRFLARVSHEVRTPLNAIVGMTDLISETDLDETQDRYLDIVRDSSRTLLGLINEILDFAKYESYKVTLERVEFDLQECIESAMDMVTADIENKKLGFIFDMDASLPVRVVGDRMRLRQVILNLFTNAIKFTQSGQVVITASSKPFSNDQIMLQCSVSDSGIGIAADKIDSLFTEFVQESSATSRKFGGTGLGLAISREICRAAGGDISCISTPGEGATFSFQFKLGIAEQKNSYPLAGKKIGCVKCNDVMESALRNVAERERMHCMIVTTVDELEQSPVDVIVVTDDSDFAGIKRYIQPHGDSPPLIQLAQHHPDAVLRRSHLKMGPFKPSDFRSTLYECLGLDSQDTTQVPAAQDEFNIKPGSILVAEDQSINQLVISTLLRSLGYQADIVGDGREALAAVQAGDYDLILMDIQMPEMDGITASRKIRELNSLIQQPTIVAITADALPGDKELCLSAGMNDYLTKPLSKLTLERMLENLFASSSRNVTAPHSSTSQATPSVAQEFIISLRQSAIMMVEELIANPDISNSTLASAIEELITARCISRERLALLDLSDANDLKLLREQLQHSQLTTLI